jgi:hypothetical protein
MLLTRSKAPTPLPRHLHKRILDSGKKRVVLPREETNQDSYAHLGRGGLCSEPGRAAWPTQH